MAGLLLHAVAGMPAGGFRSSHSAAAPLLPPSTHRTPLTPRSWRCCRLARVALLCLQGWVHCRETHNCHVPVGYFVETFAKNVLAIVGASIQRSEGQEFNLCMFSLPFPWPEFDSVRVLACGWDCSSELCHNQKIQALRLPPTSLIGANRRLIS